MNLVINNLWVGIWQIPTHPPTYKIRALNGEFYEKKFYTEELIKINHSQFPIDAFEVIDEDNENI